MTQHVAPACVTFFKDPIAMKRQLTALGALLLASSVFAAAPRLDDYAQGIRMDGYSGRPLAETLLPDAVYQTITRADLGDVRVFNADGVPVPHAFCTSPVTSEPTITQEPLPVFELQAAPQGNGDGTHVEVATAAGTQIRVQEGVRVQEGEPGATDAGATQTWAHVLDARSIADELRAIEFDWHSPDGASQANVRIEASDDLDRWQTVVGASTLLRVGRDGRQLQRKSIALPQRRYRYLRVARTDRGPPLQITAVIAERVSAPPVIEPVWFAANPLPSSDADVLSFDAARLAPITYARLALPQDNSSVRISIQSRADDKVDWRSRWSGEMYSVVADGERRVSPPAEINAGPDRYWRVQYSKRDQVLTPAPALELGYRPARLRFLTQGTGPFMLAFGSRRVEAAPIQQCSDLLADVATKDLEEMVGEAILGPPQSLGGDTAFKPLPKKTPLRLLVLWGVLIVGVGLLVAMAMSLLKRVRND